MVHNDYVSIFNKIEELKVLIRAKANTAKDPKEQRLLNIAGVTVEDQIEYQIEKAEKQAKQRG